MTKWAVQTERQGNQVPPPVKSTGDKTGPPPPCLANIAQIFQNLFSQSGGRGGGYAA